MVCTRTQNGKGVVRKRGRKTRKGKLEGEGVGKKRRDKKTRAATGADVVNVRCGLVCAAAVFITSIIL